VRSVLKRLASASSPRAAVAARTQPSRCWCEQCRCEQCWCENPFSHPDAECRCENPVSHIFTGNIAPHAADRTGLGVFAATAEPNRTSKSRCCPRDQHARHRDCAGRTPQQWSRDGTLVSCLHRTRFRLDMGPRQPHRQDAVIWIHARRADDGRKYYGVGRLPLRQAPRCRDRRTTIEDRFLLISNLRTFGPGR